MSGGIDSTVAYYYLGKPQPVYFNLNSRYSGKELRYLPSLIDSSKHQLIVDKSLRFLGGTEEDLNAHIPYRNLYLAMTASAKYADKVYIVGVKDDNMTDKNEESFKLWSDHLSNLEQRQIEIVSPFWDMTKSNIIKWFIENFMDAQDILLNTVSCYNKSNEKYCGKCQACFRKASALFTAGIELNFDSEEIKNYYRGRISGGIYDYTRRKEMYDYLEFLDSKI